MFSSCWTSALMPKRTLGLLYTAIYLSALEVRHDEALYKSTFTLLYFTLQAAATVVLQFACERSCSAVIRVRSRLRSTLTQEHKCQSLIVCLPEATNYTGTGLLSLRMTRACIIANNTSTINRFFFEHYININWMGRPNRWKMVLRPSPLQYPTPPSWEIWTHIHSVCCVAIAVSRYLAQMVSDRAEILK